MQDMRHTLLQQQPAFEASHPSMMWSGAQGLTSPVLLRDFVSTQRNTSLLAAVYIFCKAFRVFDCVISCLLRPSTV
jgi:hypothetical protein